MLSGPQFERSKASDRSSHGAVEASLPVAIVSDGITASEAKTDWSQPPTAADRAAAEVQSKPDRLDLPQILRLSIGPLARAGATPNPITLAWIVIALAGALCLLASHRAGRIAGGLLLGFSYLLDFIDGEVARLTRRNLIVGGFLDLITHSPIKPSLAVAVGCPWSKFHPTAVRVDLISLRTTGCNEYG